MPEATYAALLTAVLCAFPLYPLRAMPATTVTAAPAPAATSTPVPTSTPTTTPASRCPPPAATWTSASPFAVHQMTVAGQPYIIAANEDDYGKAEMSQLTWAESTGAWGVCADQPGVGWPYPERRRDVHSVAVTPAVTEVPLLAAASSGEQRLPRRAASLRQPLL